MNRSELKTSKYLKKEDCDPPILVTIASVQKENMAQEGQKPDWRYAMYFEELEKPLILNPTNGDLVAEIVGTTDYDGEDESAEWIGHKIVLYNEPNVTFHGKRTGGVRVRAPRVKQPAPEVPAGKQKRDWDENDDTDIPF